MTTSLPPPSLLAKSDTEIEQHLLGLDLGTINALLRFRHTPTRDILRESLPGLVAFHLPRGAALPPSPLPDHLRVAEDLGLDSLAVSEMTFKLEEVFGFTAETRDVFEIRTVGALIDFLGGKLGLS